MSKRGQDRLPWILVALVFLIGDAILAIGFWRRHREQRHDEAIAAASKTYSMDPAVVKAVVWKESRFDAASRGKAGEVGLMQIRDLAAREWADAERLKDFTMEHLTSPSTNTLAGTWYLKKLLGRYRHTDGALVYALADYNAGRANVLKWAKGSAATNSALFAEQIGFPMTRKYVADVLARTSRYAGDFPEVLKP
ncbi:MAG: lytic transglycosylase domain-containing protein [Verrucomicrobia bacterium]|nr:lytic transglycosylase domain-containing protein [Verrucomicrobiota bacterium]